MSKNQDTRTGAGANDLWETVKTVAFALLLALAIKTLVFQPFTIP